MIIAVDPHDLLGYIGTTLDIVAERRYFAVQRSEQQLCLYSEAVQYISHGIGRNVNAKQLVHRLCGHLEISVCRQSVVKIKLSVYYLTGTEQ